MAQPSKPTDGELLTAFLADNGQAAFAELVDRYGSMVHGVCLRVLTDHHEAQDVAQAVFLALARKASTMRGAESVGGWLHKVAWRLAINTQQSRIRRQRREENAMRDQPTMSEAQPDAGLFRTELDAAVNQLPDRYRQPLVLFHLLGCSLDETSRQLSLNPSTTGNRLARAREMLRKKLIRRGLTVGSVGALTTLLSAEAGAAVLPATFVSATVQAASLAAAGQLAAGVGTGVVSAKVAALTKWAMNMLFWNSVKTAAVTVAATLVVAGGGALVAQEVAAQRGAADQPTTQTHAVTVAKPAATRPGPEAVVIVPHTYDAGWAFRELARKGGPRVAGIMPHGYTFTTARTPYFLVPPELRFVPVDARTLIEAVAASRGLKIAWLRNNQWAVFYEGVAESEVLAFGKNADDVSDADLSLWIDSFTAPGAYPHYLRGLDLADAIITLNVRGEKALPFIEKMLADQNSGKRQQAIMALEYVDGERALALIEKAIADPDAEVRKRARSAAVLRGMSADKLLPLIEKALADPDHNERSNALGPLAQVGGAKALALIEKALADPDAGVRVNALSSLGWAAREDADPRVMSILEKAMDDRDIIDGDDADTDDYRYWKSKERQDASFRVRAASLALGAMGGEKAFALLEKRAAGSREGKQFRRPGYGAAMEALGNIGSDKAWALLMKGGAESIHLEHVGDKALAYFEKGLSSSNEYWRKSCRDALQSMNGLKPLYDRANPEKSK
jgi:RNA polymerase sigma factor (sigma-70 family)